MANTDDNKGILKRLIGSKSVQVTLDSAGRICIPEEMVKAAGLPKDVMLVGVLDAFEIWDPAKYEQVSKADEVMAAQAFRFME
jgi:MraZ protein